MNLSGVDLNLLLAFDALMTHRSVTAAGAAVGLTQPAMSNALARLRNLFNDPLFIRGGGGMSPTARAQAAHPAVRSALTQIQSALDGFEQFDPARAVRVFQIAMAEDAAFYLLPLVIKRLAVEAPGIDIKVHSTAQILAADLLAAGTAELAVGRVPRKFPKELLSRPVYQERVVCIGRRGHPALRKLTLEKFLAAQHIIALPNMLMPSRLDVTLAKLGHARRVALSVPHFLMVPSLLPGTEMLGTVAERVARHFAPIVGLDVRPLPFALAPYEVAIIWHRGYEQDAGHAWLRRVIAAEAVKL
jgi:DNA-binding transcriptional LysR family regulator